MKIRSKLDLVQCKGYVKVRPKSGQDKGQGLLAERSRFDRVKFKVKSRSTLGQVQGQDKVNVKVKVISRSKSMSRSRSCQGGGVGLDHGQGQGRVNLSIVDLKLGLQLINFHIQIIKIGAGVYELEQFKILKICQYIYCSLVRDQMAQNQVFKLILMFDEARA